MDLTADNLKLEHELEISMNSNLEIGEKVEKIKLLLSKIVTNEASLTKFTNLVSNNNNNDLIKKKDEQN